MKNALRLSILALAAGVGLHAGPLTLNPSTIYGLPGDTVGWGFALDLQSASWVSVVTTSLLNETNPGLLDLYTDFAGAQGGPDNGVIDPNGVWTESFDIANSLGIGSYAIDPAALLGATDSGTIDLNYETFSGDPNSCSQCATGFGDVYASFTVEVGAQPANAPEPAALWLAGLGLLTVWGRWRMAGAGPNWRARYTTECACPAAVG